MTSTITTRRFRAGGWAVAGLAAALAVSSGAGVVDAREVSDWHAIEGVWLVQVQLQVCATGAPIGPPFSSVVTFHEGGTLTETTSSPGFAPGQRTPGQGTWDTLGHGVYSQKMIALITFATDPNPPVTPGFLAGWSVVDHTLELTDQDHITSSGTNVFYRTDGTAYRTGCSTATGVRFQ